MKHDNVNQNPWAGLSSYEDPAKSKQKLKFCGRDNETKEVARLIDDNFFVTLYGKSGIGKTSLLNAGVFPTLRREQYTPLSLRLGMTEETSSFQDVITQAIERTIDEIGGSVHIVNVTEEQSEQDTIDYLWRWFARRRFLTANGQITFPVLVFDQFEEVFRHEESRRKTKVLLEQMNYLIDESHAIGDCAVDGEEYNYDFNFRCVLSIREDDLYRLEDALDNCALPALKRCRYRLRSLSEEGAHKAILIPGEGLFNEEEKNQIAQAILGIARNKEDNSISTNLLSLVCSRLYINYAQNKENYINLKSVSDFNGDNFYNFFYEETIKNLSLSEILYLEDHLVDKSGHRNSISESDFLYYFKNGMSLLYGDNRILQRVSLSSGGDDYRIELLHDRLADAVLAHKNKAKQIRQNKIKIFYIVSSLLIMFLLTIFLSMCDGTNSTITYQTKEVFTLDHDNAILSQDYSYNDNIQTLIIETMTSFHGVSISFKNCLNLNEVIFKCPDDISVDCGMFANCTRLRSVGIYDNDTNSIVSVKDTAFINCKSLHKIDLQSAEFIYGKSFMECSSLDSLILSNIKFIDYKAFANCEKLRYISLGRDIDFIDKTAFNGCPNIYFEVDKNAVFSYENGILWKEDADTVDIVYIRGARKNTTQFVQFPKELKSIRQVEYDHTLFINTNINDSQAEFLVPNTDYVTGFSNIYCSVVNLTNCNNAVISDSAFYNNPTIKKVVFPNCLKRIGSFAFAGCVNLEEIDLSLCSVEWISHNAFANCPNLKSVKLSPSTKKMGLEVFGNCKGLESIDMLDCQIVSINPSMFINCEKLGNIVLPRTVRTIKQSAFEGCKNLTKIDLHIIESIESHSFAKSGLSSITLKDSMKMLCTSAFAECSNLALLVLPHNIQNLDIDYVIPSVIKIKGGPNLEIDSNKCTWYIKRDSLGKITSTQLVSFGNSPYYVENRHTPSSGRDSSYLCINGALLYKEYDDFSNDTILYLLDIPNNIIKYSLPKEVALSLSRLDPNKLNKIDLGDADCYQKKGDFLFPVFGIMSHDIHSIYNIGEGKIMNVPPTIKPYKYTLCGTCNIEEIHIPFTACGFEILGLSKTEKERITLFVPYGCSEKYSHNNLYSDFKTIKEDSVLRQLYVILEYNIKLQFFNRYFLISYLLLFLFVFAIAIRHYSKKENRSKMYIVFAYAMKSTILLLICNLVLICFLYTTAEEIGVMVVAFWLLPAELSFYYLWLHKERAGCLTVIAKYSIFMFMCGLCYSVFSSFYKLLMYFGIGNTYSCIISSIVVLIGVGLSMRYYSIYKKEYRHS